LYCIGNLGHLLWDLWLPLHSMLDVFGIIQKPLLLTYDHTKRQCILPIRRSMENLFGIQNDILVNKQIQIPQSKSSYICSDHTVVGYGWLNDHGFNNHGWIDSEMEYPVNYQRGMEFRQFRKYLLAKIGLEAESNAAIDISTPLLIIFSQRSSSDNRRSLEFSTEIMLAKDLPLRSQVQISVQIMDHRNMTLNAQLQLVSTASIFVTAAGGGSFPAFFLPKGAVLIVYGDPNMHLDSDVYNNYGGQIRIHWMSIRSKEKDLQLLHHLLLDEIEMLTSKFT
jgi:Glycosyltransferase 61